MTVSEFMFLAIGLLLGVASGAALVEVIRARPPARHEVRLTVSTDAIPRRRGSTLADDAFVMAGPEPARGGPADRRAQEGPAPPGTPERRTNVLSPGMVGMSISAGADPMLGALQAGSRGKARSSAGSATAIRSQAAREQATGTAASSAGTASTTQTSVALLDPPATAPAAGPVAPRTYSGPCADERRLADERCEVATRAQAQASAAADALRRAQRAYDTHTAAAEDAAEAAHPHAVRSLKEGAQREFRAASRAALSPEAVEAAARTWLQEINRINREAAGASLVAEREREAAASVGARLERMSIEADAARVGFEMANAACVAARTAVADCDEREQAGVEAPSAAPASPPPTDPILSDMAADEVLGIALQGGTAPRIFRLLRGDPEAMDTMVARLADDDPEEQRRWKLAIAGLLDAILADAIEQAYLRFPHEHAFWGPQTQEQNRDITQALASLGYRFDGLGGWVDERLPGQREMSLAMGYAGLDPMRVRHWPNEQQTAELFATVDVAADEYLAGTAGDLTLAEMVEMLGRRADGLVDLWNNWGRIRPLLLEER
ncbi:MAG: hypothetical protein WEE50_10915 [Chloroflexota bacterium]